MNKLFNKHLSILRKELGEKKHTLHLFHNGKKYGVRKEDDKRMLFTASDKEMGSLMKTIQKEGLIK